MTRNAMNKGPKPQNKQSANARKAKQSTTVSVPLARSVVNRTSKPKVNGKEGIIIKRCEFVGTATNGASTHFALTPLSMATPGYDFNPSVSALFPWLSGIATAYERFRFRKLSFRFVPSQAATTAGRFYAAVDYDYDDSPSSTKATMMGNYTAVETPVWQECRLDCDPTCLNRDLPYRYISCSTRGLFVENRTAYSGFLMLAFDTPTANLLMDIWVDYEIELVTPVLDELIEQSLDASSTNWVATANVLTADTAGFTGAVPMALTNVSAGPLGVVTPGSQGVPQLVPSGQSKLLATAVDLVGAKGIGTLILEIFYNVTGQTPAGLMASGETANWAVYDSFGAYLTEAASYAKGLLGSLVPANVATTSSPLRNTLTLDLHNLYATYPTARYVAPYLHGPAAAGAGNRGAGFSWSI